MESEQFDFAGQHGAVKSDLYDWVESAVFAVVCMILVFTFLGRIVTVVGESMEHTLQNSDKLISSRLFYTPDYGDIVIITQPNDRNEPLIKRVIATEGQTVDIDFEKGIVYVDGKALEEPYTAAPTYVEFDVVFPQTVPEGKVFVMGDNRNASWDSRDSEVGMIDERYILGRTVYRISPWENRGNPDDKWRNED